MIPIARPYLGEEEIAAVREVIRSGWIMQGPRVKEFEEAFRACVGSNYACAVSSGTAALHMGLLAVGVKPKDVVITVSHSFIATANSVRHCGAEPVFVDIDPDTFNMSVAELERCLKECKLKKGVLFHKLGRVAAIMPVHQLGMPADMKGILALACEFGLSVVEDAACALGSEISTDGGMAWNRIGKPHGDIACFSFHPRKVITTGEGGMITTDNPVLDEKVRLLRNHGMSVSAIARHEAKKAMFEEYAITGFNFRITDMQAAVGLEQLKKLPTILASLRKASGLYAQNLKSVGWLKLPGEPAYCRTNWHGYPVRLLENSPLSRDALLQHLLDVGISTRRGVMNAHQEPAYAMNIKLKNSEKARDAVMLLPIFCSITEEEIKKVSETIKNA